MKSWNTLFIFLSIWVLVSPVNISKPSSTVETAYIWNKPFLQASITSSFSTRFWMFIFGIITPWLAVKPFCLHISKNPSIFSFTPPIGCISPFWLTEPVTAIYCLIGIFAIDENNKYNSVEDALSPSIYP